MKVWPFHKLEDSKNITLSYIASLSTVLLVIAIDLFYSLYSNRDILSIFPQLIHKFIVLVVLFFLLILELRFYNTLVSYRAKIDSSIRKGRKNNKKINLR